MPRTLDCPTSELNIDDNDAMLIVDQYGAEYFEDLYSQKQSVSVA